MPDLTFEITVAGLAVFSVALCGMALFWNVGRSDLKRRTEAPTIPFQIHAASRP
jgi:hypothetical protein